MKVTIFNSSPRGKNGNTAIIVNAFIEGLKEKNVDYENIFLKDMKINPCLGCFECWKNRKNKCIIKDDVETLMEKFIKSDIVIFATPLYVDNVSGIMKNFMDRSIPLIKPEFEKDENGEIRHVKRYNKYPYFVVISNCGFPEQSHFQVISLLFKRIARNLHTKVIGEIYRGEGELLKIKNVFVQKMVKKYLKTVKIAAKEIIESFEISEKIKKELEKPLIPHNLYIKGANKSW